MHRLQKEDWELEMLLDKFEGRRPYLVLMGGAHFENLGLGAFRAELIELTMGRLMWTIEPLRHKVCKRAKKLEAILFMFLSSRRSFTWQRSARYGEMQGKTLSFLFFKKSFELHPSYIDDVRAAVKSVRRAHNVTLWNSNLLVHDLYRELCISHIPS